MPTRSATPAFPYQLVSPKPAAVITSDDVRLLAVDKARQHAARSSAHSSYASYWLLVSIGSKYIGLGGGWQQGAIFGVCLYGAIHNYYRYVKSNISASRWKSAADTASEVDLRTNFSRALSEEDG